MKSAWGGCLSGLCRALPCLAMPSLTISLFPWKTARDQCCLFGHEQSCTGGLQQSTVKNIKMMSPACFCLSFCIHQLNKYHTINSSVDRQHANPAARPHHLLLSPQPTTSRRHPLERPDQQPKEGKKGTTQRDRCPDRALRVRTFSWFLRQTTDVLLVPSKRRTPTLS
jgi:hypothetical protein